MSSLAQNIFPLAEQTLNLCPQMTLCTVVLFTCLFCFALILTKNKQSITSVNWRNLYI